MFRIFTCPSAKYDWRLCTRSAEATVRGVETKGLPPFGFVAGPVSPVDARGRPQLDANLAINTRLSMLLTRTPAGS
jgi:hypothetical protein